MQQEPNPSQNVNSSLPQREEPIDPPFNFGLDAVRPYTLSRLASHIIALLVVIIFLIITRYAILPSLIKAEDYSEDIHAYFHIFRLIDIEFVTSVSIVLLVILILVLYWFLSSGSANDSNKNNSKRVNKLNRSDYLLGESSSTNPAILKLRIYDEIERLTAAANFNLAIGGGITFIIFLFLVFEIYSHPINLKDYISVLSQFLPRLGLVVFGEIFAFFFLRIYKDNLNQVKYLHNELTNIEMKFAAVKIAINNKENVDLDTVIDQLISTERNFKLSKGESTIELEKEKIEAKSDKYITDLFLKFLKSKSE